MTRQRKLLPNLWRPFGRLPSLFEEEEEFFPAMRAFDNEGGLSVSEDNGSILVEAAVPGLKVDDIEVSIDNGNLWVKGQKSEEEEDKSRKYYRKASQSYSYCVSLPETYDESEEPEAVCEDGVLKVTLAKKESTQPKKIKIKR